MWLERCSLLVVQVSLFQHVFVLEKISFCCSQILSFTRQILNIQAKRTTSLVEQKMYHYLSVKTNASLIYSLEVKTCMFFQRRK